MKIAYTFSVFIALIMLVLNVQAESLESLMMPGKVIEGHVKWEESCQKCHKKFDKLGQTALCKDCHEDIHKDITTKKGFHGKIDPKKQCNQCHTEHKGRTADIAPINENTFKHADTDFALKGAHAETKVKCKDCHESNKKYREAPSACNACHKKDDEHKGTLGTKCESCHVEKDWKDTALFDHNQSKFALEGKHIDVKCNDCHLNKKYRETPKLCESCHQKDDKHKGVFGKKCETCHLAKSWQDTTFNHNKDTKYQLKGKHASTKCESCHKPGNRTLKLATTCYVCHKSDDKHDGTLGTNCAECHTERNWSDTPGFDHDQTKFPLKDKHKTAKCQSCHKNGMKEKLPLTCNACHKADDKHKGNFGTTCESCHTAKNWKQATKFDHDRDTQYPLKDKHKQTSCVECHKGKLYGQNLKTTCVTCHKKDDEHKGRYGEKCETCHLEKGWKSIIFNHDKETKYRLLFKHQSVKCDACHKANLYQDKLKTNCINCHKSDDEHKGQLGDKCESCHSEQSWKKTEFDHAKSKFPLLGRHYYVECKDCHKTPQYKDAKTDCNSCHVKDDAHKGRLGTGCETCHNARDWKIWDFDHDQKTGFALDGGHKGINCYECHSKPSKSKKLATPVTCGQCHFSDDIHDGGFGQQCDRCHQSTNWRDLKVGVGFAR
jgi:hypothetical protein